ncbi:hypothetical protein QE152_g40167 [Popillia japonica]|uniref:Uncharacterized protein n=1 Tax=Popillia japonica TaxID=7064 RepID=A0AAW1HS88_POPJA
MGILSGAQRGATNISVTCFTGTENSGEAPELIANTSESAQTNFQTVNGDEFGNHAGCQPARRRGSGRLGPTDLSNPVLKLFSATCSELSYPVMPPGQAGVHGCKKKLSRDVTACEFTSEGGGVNARKEKLKK